jgi:hypothetical protein
MLLEMLGYKQKPGEHWTDQSERNPGATDCQHSCWLMLLAVLGSLWINGVGSCHTLAVAVSNVGGESTQRKFK